MSQKTVPIILKLCQHNWEEPSHGWVTVVGCRAWTEAEQHNSSSGKCSITVTVCDIGMQLSDDKLLYFASVGMHTSNYSTSAYSSSFHLSSSLQKASKPGFYLAFNRSTMGVQVDLTVVCLLLSVLCISCNAQSVGKFVYTIVNTAGSSFMCLMIVP